MLIKAGAFRNISNKNPLELLEEYLHVIKKPKKDLNGRNLQMLIKMDLFPKDYLKEVQSFNWWAYTKKQKSKSKDYVLLDDNSLRYYENNYDLSKIVYFDSLPHISKSYGKSLVDKTNEVLKRYISENKEILLEKVNYNLYLELWEKYKTDSIIDAEMESLRMYTGKHPLLKYGMSYDKITDMREDHFVGEFNIDGKKFPKYHIYRTVGTVIAKNKLKNMITLLTPEGAIEVKLWNDIFALYDKASVEVIDGQTVVIQDSFFAIGTHLVIFGKFQDRMFFPKVYKGTGVEYPIYKLNLNDTVTLEEKLG